MAIVSISEAARLTGKSRKTIQRYVADGRISLSQRDAGRGGVDISELVRVFGELSQPVPTLSHASVSQRDAPDVTALEARIQGLEAQLSAKDGLLEAKERHIASMEIALRLLEHTPTKRPWWRFRG
ncbi:hypothetical protein AX768_31730 (plasmid) [Burkholderia sp. PAMC 28687]|uniref:hypothetical protein n=1 Tax=Burkholderia sp. PAMC 28687 TaxID=1795874 RepID=UPI000782A215|nr:hypothetical protein [Burkholderia sp. PAMC 28687]AMM18812.1 hypothetical protein AX768_31730 [Burkholderia sp. PAMC 28687]